MRPVLTAAKVAWLLHESVLSAGCWAIASYAPVAVGLPARPIAASVAVAGLGAITGERYRRRSGIAPTGAGDAGAGGERAPP